MAIIAASTITLMGIDDEIKDINIHQAVFFGILRDSDTVERDLAALGLNPEKLSSLAGTTYYDSQGVFDPAGELMREEFFSKISYQKIIGYYLTHPLVFIEKMNVTANNAFTIVQEYVGNFQEGSGKLPNENIYGIWSSLKLLFPNNLIFLLIVAALFLYVIFAGRKGKGHKEKLLTDLLLFIFFIAVFSFVMPYVADGDGDLSKHLFLFSLTFDMLFIACILWGCQKITDRCQKRMQS